MQADFSQCEIKAVIYKDKVVEKRITRQLHQTAPRTSIEMALKMAAMLSALFLLAAAAAAAYYV